MKQTPEQIISSPMALPAEQRAAIISALQDTIVSDTFDHGPAEAQDEVEAAWAAEIKQRVEDIRSGKVQTISSEEAWKLIDGDTPQV